MTDRASASTCLAPTSMDTVADAFERSGLPYAFGGAIALLYAGEPRSTADIDLNVFINADAAARALDTVPPLAPHSTGTRRSPRYNARAK